MHILTEFLGRHGGNVQVVCEQGERIGSDVGRYQQVGEGRWDSRQESYIQPHRHRLLQSQSQGRKVSARGPLFKTS